MRTHVHGHVPGGLSCQMHSRSKLAHTLMHACIPYCFCVQVLGMILNEYLVVSQEKVYKLILHRL